MNNKLLAAVLGGAALVAVGSTAGLIATSVSQDHKPGATVSSPAAPSEGVSVPAGPVSPNADPDAPPPWAVSAVTATPAHVKCGDTYNVVKVTYTWTNKYSEAAYLYVSNGYDSAGNQYTVGSGMTDGGCGDAPNDSANPGQTGHGIAYIPVPKSVRLTSVGFEGYTEFGSNLIATQLVTVK